MRMVLQKRKLETLITWLITIKDKECASLGMLHIGLL